MLIIANTLLGFIIAMLLNFAWVWFWSRMHRPKNEELLENVHKQFYFSEPTQTYSEFSLQHYDF